MNRQTIHGYLQNARRAGNPAGEAAVARAVALPAHQRRDGTEGVCVTIPNLRVENPCNLPGSRQHWAKRRPLRLHQQAMIALFLGRLPALPRLPASVRLVRVYAGRGKALDSDGLEAAFKHVRDSVAALYGVSDAPGGPLAWAVAQERGEATGVRVEISPKRA